MNPKLIAADLDGTLLNHNSRLTPATAEVLFSARKSGTLLVIATGRAFDTLPEQVKNFPYFDYAITSNGAVIYDMRTKQRLVGHFLAEDAARRLIDFALTHSLGLEMISDGKAYGEKYYFEHSEDFGFDEKSRRYLHTTRTKIDDLHSFLQTHIDRLESIDFVLKDGCDSDAIRQFFRKDKSLYITSSHPRFLEFSSNKCGKGKALQWLLMQEKIDPADVIAFGNAENDIDMMHLAACGIATAGSPESVKKQADAVCGSCDEDGVAKYLLRLLNAHN